MSKQAMQVVCRTLWGADVSNMAKKQGESPEPFDNVRLGSLFCAVGAKAFSFLWDAPRPFDNVGPDNV